MPLRNGRYEGHLFRALNPVYAREPLSGRGAEIHGGRFNRKGRAALYTALDPATALREANQVGSFQPTVLVSYHADLGPLFDTGDQDAFGHYGMTVSAIADPGWRSSMLDRRTVPTQEFAEALMVDGFTGLLVRSFAAHTTKDNLNIVLWRWDGDGCQLDVVDDEARLARM